MFSFRFHRQWAGEISISMAVLSNRVKDCSLFKSLLINISYYAHLLCTDLLWQRAVIEQSIFLLALSVGRFLLRHVQWTISNHANPAPRTKLIQQIWHKDSIPKKPGLYNLRTLLLNNILKASFCLVQDNDPLTRVRVIARLSQS